MKHGYKNILKNKPLRQFIIKTTILILSLFLIRTATQIFFHFFPLYHYVKHPFDKAPFSISDIVKSASFIAFAFILYSRNKLLKLEKHKTKLKEIIVFGFLSAFFLGVYYYFRFLVNKYSLVNHLTIAYITELFLLLLFFISLVISIYGISFIKQSIKQFKKEIGVFSIIFVLYYLMAIKIMELWIYLSNTVTIALYYLFELTYDDVSMNLLANDVASKIMAGGGPTLRLENFSAVIGKACSGVDSMLLFTSLFILIFALDYEALNKKAMMLLFFPGLIGMFAFNILRIYLLFIVGAHISQSLAVGLFHTNAGWILFIAYFMVFWWSVSKFAYKK